MKTWWSAIILIAMFSMIASATGQEEKKMELTSSDFGNNESICKEFTCDGEDISPALQWSGAPEGTRSFALIVDDPDAPDPANPRMTWVHWVLYNMPPTADSLPQAATEQDLPEGTMQGLNDWKKTGFGGPCPPIGEHRYFFKLYALDTELSGLGNPAKADLEKAMKGHVLGKAELVGLYRRK